MLLGNQGPFPGTVISSQDDTISFEDQAIFHAICRSLNRVTPNDNIIREIPINIILDLRGSPTSA